MSLTHWFILSILKKGDDFPFVGRFLSYSKVKVTEPQSHRAIRSCPWPSKHSKKHLDHWTFDNCLGNKPHVHHYTVFMSFFSPLDTSQHTSGNFLFTSTIHSFTAVPSSRLCSCWTKILSEVWLNFGRISSPCILSHLWIEIELVLH